MRSPESWREAAEKFRALAAKPHFSRLKIGWLQLADLYDRLAAPDENLSTEACRNLDSDEDSFA